MQVGQDWGLRVERAGWGRIERLLKKMMEAEGGACGNVEDLGEDVLFGVVAVVWWDGWQMKDRSSLCSPPAPCASILPGAAISLPLQTALPLPQEVLAGLESLASSCRSFLLTHNKVPCLK